MKFLVTVLLAWLLLIVESVVVRQLGLSVVRVDASVAIVAFLALRANTLEGSLSSFAVGYLADLLSGRPTGLYTFLAVLLFVLGRIGASLVDVRSAARFALYSSSLGLAHGLGASLLSWIHARDAGGAPLSWLPLQLVLTGLAAFILYPLLRRIDPGQERPALGTLR